MAEAKKNGWGGKREGAGRRPGAVDGTERKMRSLRASDGEWEAIKSFAKFIKGIDFLHNLCCFIRI